MIELERHIEILLLDNDCVIVPGLGGFMAHHIEARYDSKEELFLPPIRTLGFNPQLKMNDSLLAQSYVEAYDISYPEAVRRIENEVRELKQILETEGCYELNDVGMLKVNPEGKIIFVPCEAGILTPNLYGLSSFEFKTYQVQETGESKTAYPMQPIETRNSQTKSPQQSKKDDNFIRIKVNWIRNCAAAIIAFVAFFVLSTPLSLDSNKSYEMSGVHKTINELLATKSKSISASFIDSTLLPKTREIASPDKNIINKSEATDLQKSDSSYCIILASKTTRRNADLFVKRLKKGGYDNSYVLTNNNIVRVAFGNFHDKDEAQKQLRMLQEDKIFEQAWIYKKQ